MSDRKAHLLFSAAAAFCITLIALLFISEAVICQHKKEEQELLKQYREMEKSYVRNMRNFLTGAGFENSGVNLTSVTDEEGNRQYKIVIHHRDFDRLSSDEKQMLEKELTSFVFQTDNCTFCHEFLPAY